MTTLLATFVAGAALLGAQAAPPPPPADADSASVARVRAALERPPALRMDVDLPKPDFVVRVVEKPLWFERWIPPPDYRSGPVPPGGLYAYEQQQRLNPNAAVPLFSIPLLPMIRGLAHSFSGPNPGAAHAAVLRAIAEYCAAQPNGGTNIAICMDPTSIR